MMSVPAHPAARLNSARRRTRALPAVPRSEVLVGRPSGLPHGQQQLQQQLEQEEHQHQQRQGRTSGGRSLSLARCCGSRYLFRPAAATDGEHQDGTVGVEERGGKDSSENSLLRELHVLSNMLPRAHRHIACLLAVVVAENSAASADGVPDNTVLNNDDNNVQRAQSGWALCGLIFEEIDGALAEDMRVRRANRVWYSADQVVAFAMQLASAIGYLHAHGVAHTQVRAENVWFALKGFKIHSILLGGDFSACVFSPTGLRRSVGDDALKDAMAGDVRSFGLLLGELLCERGSSAGLVTIGREEGTAMGEFETERLRALSILARRCCSEVLEEQPTAAEICAELGAEPEADTQFSDDLDSPKNILWSVNVEEAALVVRNSTADARASLRLAESDSNGRYSQSNGKGVRDRRFTAHGGQSGLFLSVLARLGRWGNSGQWNSGEQKNAESNFEEALRGVLRIEHGARGQALDRDTARAELGRLSQDSVVLRAYSARLSSGILTHEWIEVCHDTLHAADLGETEITDLELGITHALLGEAAFLASPEQADAAAYKFGDITRAAMREVKRRHGEKGCFGALEHCNLAGKLGFTPALVVAGKHLRKDFPAKARRLFEIAAEAGIAAGRVELAKCFLATHAEPCTGECKNGISFLREAHEQGFRRASVLLLRALIQHISLSNPTEPDCNDARMDAASLAEIYALMTGFDEAACSPTERRKIGESLLLIPEKIRAEHAALNGEVWLEHASDAGDAVAMRILASRKEEKCSWDDSEYANWIWLAAEGGDAIAQVRMAEMCLVGTQQVDKDTDAAEMWLKRASSAGNATAQLRLSSLLRDEDPVMSFKWARLAAEQGSAAAMAEVGICLSTGSGVARDITQAVEWLSRAVESNEANNAYHALGIALCEGTGVKRDVGRAVSTWRKGAELGAPGCASSLAMELLNQFESRAFQLPDDELKQLEPDSLEEASFWLALAASEDDPTAERELGIRTRSEKLLRRCADRDDPIAALELAVLLQERQTISSRDHADIRRFLHRAAECGDARAIRHYASLQARTGDLRDAWKWWSKGARHGDAVSRLNKAWFLEHNLGPVSDPEAAFRIYHDLAEEENLLGSTHAGRCLVHGAGCKPDPKAGKKLLQKGAQGGVVAAMRELAWTCESDSKEQEKWFRLASEKDDVVASHELGVLLLKSSANERQAEGWKLVEMAAKHGCILAMRNAAVCCLRGLGRKRSRSQGIRWIQAAADGGSSAATCELAYRTERGRGVPLNLERSHALYKKAAELGDSEGIKNCARQLEHGIGCTADVEAAADQYRRVEDLDVGDIAIVVSEDVPRTC